MSTGRFQAVSSVGVARSTPVLVAGLFGLAAVAHAQQAPHHGVGDVAAAAKPAVVHLKVFGRGGQAIGLATGFFVTADGWLVTSDHVVEAASGLHAVLSSGREVDVAGILAEDIANDIVVLKADIADNPTLELGSSSSVAEGSSVIVLGSPLGLSWTLSEGIISAIRDGDAPDGLSQSDAAAGRVLQISAPISPGSSGSPVLDEEGKVVGIARAILRGGESLNFATPVEPLKQMLAGLTSGAEVKPFRRWPVENLIISAAFFGGLGLFVLILRVLSKRRARTA